MSSHCFDQLFKTEVSAVQGNVWTSFQRGVLWRVLPVSHGRTCPRLLGTVRRRIWARELGQSPNLRAPWSPGHGMRHSEVSGACWFYQIRITPNKISETIQTLAPERFLGVGTKVLAPVREPLQSTRLMMLNYGQVPTLLSQVSTPLSSETIPTNEENALPCQDELLLLTAAFLSEGWDFPPDCFEGPGLNRPFPQEIFSTTRRKPCKKRPTVFFVSACLSFSRSFVLSFSRSLSLSLSLSLSYSLTRMVG